MHILMQYSNSKHALQGLIVWCGNVSPSDCRDLQYCAESLSYYTKEMTKTTKGKYASWLVFISFNLDHQPALAMHAIFSVW
jgi:hypothetical protein